MSAKLGIVINLKQLEDLAQEFVNGCDASADINSSDAIRHRLYMGQFLIWLRQKVKEENEQANNASGTRSSDTTIIQWPER